MFRTYIWRKEITKVRKWNSFFGSLRFLIVAIVMLVCGAVGMLISYLLSRVFSGSNGVDVVGVLAVLSPSYIWGLVIGALIMGIIIILHQDELAATLVIAVHIYIDWYLGLTFVSSILALVLLLTFFIARSNQRKWAEPHSLWLWALFLILAIFPTTRAPNFLYGADYYLNIIFDALIMLWIGILIAQDSTHIRRFFQIVSVLGALIAIHTIIEATTGKFLLESSRNTANTMIISYLDPFTPVRRVESFFLYTDTNGAFFALIFFIPLTLFTVSSSFVWKIFSLAEMLVILLALFLTYSTGAFLAAFAGVIFYASLVGNPRYRIRIFMFLFATGIVGIICFPSQLSLLYQHAVDPTELSLRTAVWQTGIRVIEAFPLTGLGIGRGVYQLRAEAFRVPAQYAPVDHPHNSYLELAALGGLPVGIVFIMLLSITLWLALRNWKQADVENRPLIAGGVAAVIALSCYSLSDAGWTVAPLAAIGWLIAGIVASPLIGRCLRRDRRTADIVHVQTETSQIDNAKLVRDMGEYGTGIVDKLKPSLEETRRYREALATSADATRLDEVLTLEPPVTGIAQLPTQIEERAIPVASPLSLPAVGGIPTTDQPTGITPVIPGTRRVGNQVNLPVTPTAGGERYLGLIRNLVKSSGIYAISSLASPLVSLLLLPFLTHALSHADYGALAVLDTVIALMAGATSLGIDAVFARVYSYECKTRREQLDALSTLALLLFLILIPVMILGVMTAPWLSMLVLGSASYGAAIALAVLLVLLQNLTIPGLMWMRVENRATPYSIISIANFLLVAGATIVLVGMLHMGVVGALIAMGLGNLIVAVCTLPLIFLRAGFHLRSATAVSMLTLGVPYAMNYITMWVLQLSDRYLLGHLASLSVAANYAIAYSLGTGTAFVVTQPFSMAWWVLIYPIARRDDAPNVFKLIFRWYSFVLLFATLGLSLFGESVLDRLFPVSYHGQSLIISVIALSTVFNSIFVVFNLGMTLQRKTWLAFIALLFSSLLNIGVNIVLIPLYGAMGAAIATLVAYIVLALVSHLFNQRIYPVPFEIGLFLVALGIGIMLYFADSRFAQGQGAVIVYGIHTGLLLLYAGTLAVLGWLPWHRKK